jgi:hypothetical protein
VPGVGPSTRRQAQSFRASGLPSVTHRLAGAGDAASAHCQKQAPTGKFSNAAPRPNHSQPSHADAPHLARQVLEAQGVAGAAATRDCKCRGRCARPGREQHRS